MVVEGTVPSDPRIVLVKPFARTRKTMNYKIIENTSKYLLATYTNKKTQESKSIQKCANYVAAGPAQPLMLPRKHNHGSSQ